MSQKKYRIFTDFTTAAFQILTAQNNSYWEREDCKKTFNQSCTFWLSAFTSVPLEGAEPTLSLCDKLNMMYVTWPRSERTANRPLNSVS